MLQRPPSDEYTSYHGTYISKVPDGDVREILRRQLHELTATLTGVSDGQASASYGPGKWTLKEMLLHVIDAERVFAYRLLRVARGDATPLPGFEQDEWVPHSGANNRSLANLMVEFTAVRAATLALMETLDDAAWARRGTASGHPTSARALAYIIAGHDRHHQTILRERYLKA